MPKTLNTKLQRIHWKCSEVLSDFSIAFLIALALMGVTVWLVRLFRANRLGGDAPRADPSHGG